MSRRADRTRLDQWLVESGRFASREKAQASIMAGQVMVAGHESVKPGTPVGPGDAVTVLGGPRYVSRGGDKLAGALDRLCVEVTDFLALDAGAATGGFVDCLLQRGARHVIALDVGYGQLAWALREDPRVTTVERQNLRFVTPEMLSGWLPDPNWWPDIVTLDLSFIGLAKVFPVVRRLVRHGGLVLALVKPQFEVGPADVGKRGVVRRADLHRRALREVADAAVGVGLVPSGVTYSALRGPQGNIEYFLLLRVGAGGGQGHSEAAQLEKIGQEMLSGEGLDAEIATAVDTAWQVLEAKVCE